MKQTSNDNSRADKISALKALQEGKISVDDLESMGKVYPEVYIFEQTSLDPGKYEMRGKMYTEDEYQSFCKRVADKNINAICWLEHKQYEQDKILTFVPCDK